MSKITATLAAVLALSFTASAGAARVHIGQPYRVCHHAHCKHRLTVRQAEAMVIHRVGPGTVVKHCWWFSATKDRCSYSTPAENQWNIEEGWSYESALTV